MLSLGLPSWGGKGGAGGWAHPAAVRALDFKNNRYTSQGVQYAFADLASVTRAGTGWLDSIGGIWSEFLAGVLRRTDRGAAIGGQFTNKIRNPRGEGGVVGTVGVTNKCTGYNAAPPALVTPTTLAAFNSAVTGVTVVAGDASSLFGVVDGAAALQAVAAGDPTIAAGLNNAFMNGRVVKIDNSASAAAAYLLPAGTTDGTNSSVSAYVWGTGLYRLTYQSYGPATPDQAIPATPTRAKLQNQPAGSGDKLKIIVAPGAVIYVILWQLEQGATAAPVPTVVAGAAATGTLPTNWAFEDIVTGLKCSFLGVNSEGGLPYADIRISGTSAATTNVMRVRFDQSTNATAAADQAWGLDFGGKLLSGVSPSVYARLTAFNTSSALSDGASGTSTPLTSSNVQRTAKGVISDGTTNNVRGALYLDVTSGNAYDFTIRLYAPKLVQVAVVTGTPNTAGYLPTFPIMPAAGVIADSTKLADDVRAVQVMEGAELLSGNGTDNAPVVTNVVGDAFTLSRTSSGDATYQHYWAMPTIAGKAYRVAVTISAMSHAGYFNVGASIGTNALVTNKVAATGVNYIDFVATSATSYFYMAATASLTATINFTRPSCKRLTPFAGWLAAGLGDGATELVAATFTHADDEITARPFFEYSDGTTNNRILGYISTLNKVRLLVVTAGVTQANLTLTASAAVGSKAYAFGWSAAGGYLTDGTETVTFGAITLPVGLSQKRIGASVSAGYLNDILRRDETCRPIVAADAAAWALAA